MCNVSPSVCIFLPVFQSVFLYQWVYKAVSVGRRDIIITCSVSSSSFSFKHFTTLPNSTKDVQGMSNIKKPDLGLK